MSKNEPARELSHKILSTRMAFRQSIQRVLKRNNVEMTFEMLQIMHRLWRIEGVSQQFLAENTAKDKACMTNLINNLEKKGWVFRKEDPSDKRNRLIFLTDEGRKMADEVLPLINEIYTHITEEMTAKQIQTTLNHLSKLNNILDEI